MSEQLVRVGKFFWAWQDEQREQWLRDLAREGLHLAEISVTGHYFRRGPRQDVVYRLDYNRDAGSDPEYRTLFEDAGWELAATCMGWQYWRKPAGAGPAPEIFTDRASKVAKNKRLLGLIVVANVPNLVNLAVNPALWDPGRFSSPWTQRIVLGLMIGLALISAYAVANLYRRIRALRGAMPA